MRQKRYLLEMFQRGQSIKIPANCFNINKRENRRSKKEHRENAICEMHAIHSRQRETT